MKSTASVPGLYSPKGGIGPFTMQKIGHFRITLGLFFKASVGAHPFHMQINFHSHAN